MGLFTSLIYIIVSFFTGGALILIFFISFFKRLGLDYGLQLEASLGYLLKILYNSPNFGIIAGPLGLLIVLMCIKNVQDSIAKVKREKTIAFEANYGQVSIGLSAVEDMIRKLLLEFKELKEVKPQVTASKKGLQVILKIVLSSFTNIPEFTSKIQNLVKEKLQTMLGIEEEINIKVEVRKILYSETRAKSQVTEEASPSIPYRDYQAK